QIKSHIKSNRLMITVSNGFVGEVKIQDDVPVPLNNTKEHGIGIKSIIDVLEKHDGMYIFKTENSTFIAQLLIPLE
ncbi:MAG: GHKL domain-containing protein, partial [Clostridia bacterium]